MNTSPESPLAQRVMHCFRSLRILVVTVCALCMSGCNYAENCSRYYAIDCKQGQAFAVARKWLTLRGKVLRVEYYAIDSGERFEPLDSTLMLLGDSDASDKHLKVVFDGHTSNGIRLTELTPGTTVTVRARVNNQSYLPRQRCQLYLMDAELVRK